MIQIKTFRFNVLSSCVDNNQHMKKQNAHDQFERIYDKFKDWNTEKSFIVSKNIPNIIGHITATSHGNDTDRERLDRIFVLK